MTEAGLLAAFVEQRSEAAFAELVCRHMPMVLGVCQRVLEDRSAAQDTAQAVFLALARKARTAWDGNGNWAAGCTTSPSAPPATNGSPGHADFAANRRRLP